MSTNVQPASRFQQTKLRTTTITETRSSQCTTRLYFTDAPMNCWRFLSTTTTALLLMTAPLTVALGIPTSDNRSTHRSIVPSATSSIISRDCTAKQQLAEWKETTDLFDALLTWFQGDFDNYRQVVQDRSANLLPRQGGGHEHIHCSLIPVSPTSRLAAFYFDGNPTAIFRFRFYRLQGVKSPTLDEDHGGSISVDSVDTILYTLDNDIELVLRSCKDPLQWPKVFRNYVEQQDKFKKYSNMLKTKDEDHIAEAAVSLGCVKLLPRCEVRWSWDRDPIQHAYAADFRSDEGSIHAVMIHNEALLDSQMMPGQKILIKDQLSLWKDELWIHDRGFDPVSGDFIYGNQRGIPYRMERVANMVVVDDSAAASCGRLVSDPKLAWTMGNDYRLPEEYEQNMKRIGGISRSS